MLKDIHFECESYVYFKGSCGKDMNPQPISYKKYINFYEDLSKRVHTYN